MLKLAFKNLFAHPVRTVLTIGALAIAMFLVCFLTSIATALEAGVSSNTVRRLWTRTAVSLFSTMPQNYEQKIESLPEIDQAVKFQWFGGYFREQKNFFAQFAIEPEHLLEVYDELYVVDGSYENFVADRNSAFIGKALADKYEWKVGDTIPLTATIFTKPDQSPWEFEVAAIYEADTPNVDRSTLFFHWDLFEETVKGFAGEAPEVGVYLFKPVEGADLDAVSAQVDALFEGGPMRTLTTTESEFQREFIGMIGNLPRFITFLGTGVFVAILLASINTMLMAAREQTNDVGVLKSLGFSDGRVFGLMLTQGLFLCGIGGGIGIALAKGSESAFRDMLAAQFPGYLVADATVIGAAVLTLAIGLVAGLMPALHARRLSPVAALRATL